MSIRHLRTFIAVSETGSFGAAAERVFLTHTAVSMQIKALERELAVDLFDRTHRPPQLTEAGKTLVPLAVELIRAFDRLPSTLRAPNAKETRFSIGAIPSSLTTVTPLILKMLRKRFSELHIDLTSHFSEELLHMLEFGMIDAALVSHITEPSPGIEWHPFLREPLILLAPRKVSMVNVETLISEMPFIHFRRNTWVGRLIENLLRARNIQVRETMLLDSVEAVASMVANGLGVAIVPAQRHYQFYKDSISVIRLPWPTVYRTLGVAFRTARKRDPLIRELLINSATLANTAKSPGEYQRYGLPIATQPPRHS